MGGGLKYTNLDISISRVPEGRAKASDLITVTFSTQDWLHSDQFKNNNHIAI